MLKALLNILLIGIIPLILYLKLGVLPQLLNDAPVQLGEHTVPKHALPMMIMNVEKTLQAHPDNQEAWYVLGRLCLLNGQFFCANNAFAKVREFEASASFLRKQGSIRDDNLI